MLRPGQRAEGIEAQKQIVIVIAPCFKAKVVLALPTNEATACWRGYQTGSRQTAQQADEKGVKLCSILEFESQPEHLIDCWALGHGCITARSSHRNNAHLLQRKPRPNGRALASQKRVALLELVAPEESAHGDALHGSAGAGRLCSQALRVDLKECAESSGNQAVTGSFCLPVMPPVLCATLHCNLQVPVWPCVAEAMVPMEHCNIHRLQRTWGSASPSAFSGTMMRLMVQAPELWYWAGADDVLNDRVSFPDRKPQSSCCLFALCSSFFTRSVPAKAKGCDAEVHHGHHQNAGSGNPQFVSFWTALSPDIRCLNRSQFYLAARRNFWPSTEQNNRM